MAMGTWQRLALNGETWLRMGTEGQRGVGTPDWKWGQMGTRGTW